jgi:hypothetical protein
VLHHHREEGPQAARRPRAVQVALALPDAAADVTFDLQNMRN